MSYTLEFSDGSEAIQVGSSRGWPEFAAWAAGLPDEDYPDLIHLVNFGWAEGPDVIADQVVHAAEVTPPGDPSVGATAAGVIEALRGRDEDATVMVVDTAVEPDEAEAADEEQQAPGGKSFRRQDDHATAMHMLLDAAAPLGLHKALSDGSATPEQRRAACHAVSLVSARRLKTIADGLAMDLGEHNGEKMAKLLAERVKAAFASIRKTMRTGALAATLALRGPDPLGADDNAHLSSAVAEQEGYLKAFEDEVKDGSQKPDGTLASRAEMYGRAGWAVAHQVERAAKLASGVTEERRVLGGSGEESCGVCPQLAEKGWVKARSLPGIGQTPCLTSCRCHFEYR